MPSVRSPEISEERKSKLRLLVVSSDTYPPTRVDVSVLFGEELASRGHCIDWILQSADTCNSSYAVKWGGGRVWVGATDLGANIFNRLRKHLRGLRHDLRIFSCCRSGDYDIIEVKDKFIAGLFAVIASRLFRIRYIYWLSWPFPEESITQARDRTARYPALYMIRGIVFKFILYRILMPKAHHVFVQSEQMRKDVSEEGISKDKMTAVPMGIKLSAFTSPSNNADGRLIPLGQPSILYLGTLIKMRRLDFLVRVLALVRNDIANATLYLVGRGDDPSDEKLLETEAARLGISSAVVFTGQLPWNKALRYVREAAVCVSPFYPTKVLNSTSPTKLVEYMALGRPVVANDHPEQKLIIEESRAGICVPWDEEAFARAIVGLLQNPERARKMGQRGPGYVAQHREYGMIADLVEHQLLQIAEFGRASSVSVARPTNQQSS